jgi:hypothetical protein
MGNETESVKQDSLEKTAEVDFQALNNNITAKIFLKLNKWLVGAKPVSDTLDRATDYVAGHEVAPPSGIVARIEDFYAKRLAKSIRNDAAHESDEQKRADLTGSAITKKAIELHPNSDLGILMNGSLGRLFRTEDLMKANSIITNGVSVVKHDGLQTTPMATNPPVSPGFKK